MTENPARSASSTRLENGESSEAASAETLVQVAPHVSVVIATFNSAPVLALTLRALLMQELRDFEVLVVGDGCTDDTSEVVAQLNDSRLRWIALPENSGSQSVPNTVGMRAARGRYIAFLGHDDLWFPWHLRRLVEHIESARSDFVHDLCAFVGPTGVIGGLGASPHDKNYGEHFVPPSTWLFRRELRDSVGDWRAPQTLAWPIDFDWTRRAHQHGHTISFAPHLGVLKFPSPSWKTYARQDAPQQAYVEEMLSAPRALEYRVLFEMASQGAQEWSRCFQFVPIAAQRRSFWPRLRDFLRRYRADLSERLMLAYGLERWPVSALRHRRFQEHRQWMRRQRGLK